VKVLITGANGFIGKNLQLHLAERRDVHVACFTRGDDMARLPVMLQDVDFVFHLAGVNRPQDPQEFVSGNVDLTKTLCQMQLQVFAYEPVCTGDQHLHGVIPPPPRVRQGRSAA
jgi:UDP-2-acetamido-2,6-beta-L-arabino-hexul-4-ose reductase